MRTFRCDSCGLDLYFENSACTGCGAALAFLPDARVVAPVADDGEGRLRRMGRGSAEADALYRHCDNRSRYAACNWAVMLEDEHQLCESCRSNDALPDLGDERVLALWRRMESAKRRLLYTLHDLGLGDLEAHDEGENPLRFRFLGDAPEKGREVLTGHAAGVITIALREADPSHLEATREALSEGYRTLLGHFRHESGHYFWDRLIAPRAERLESFRAAFGDERSDYAAALERHYEQPHGECPEGFVSAYAAMHPWEDWAETWAHYLHMVDTLQTAAACSIALGPREGAEVRAAETDTRDFDALAVAWTTLTVALNSLNRSMGIRDAYPFALSASAMNKLRYVHGVITGVA